MAAQTISTGLMIGGGLLTYAAAGIARAARRFQLIKQLYPATATTPVSDSTQQPVVSPKFDQEKQTFSRTDGDVICEFKWWGSNKLTEKEPELEIYRHKQAHGFELLGTETRYTTPSYINLGTVMMPVGGGRPYDVEKTLYSLFLARKEGAHNSGYSYNRYTNYSCTGIDNLPVVYDAKITSMNYRDVAKYIDNRCQDYYITAATSSYPVQKDATTNTSSTAIVPSAGTDPAGNLYVFFDNQLDIGQRVVEYDSTRPNEKGILDSRPVFFARFKAARHLNAFNGYYTRDIRDMYWRYALDARLPLTFISGVVGGVITYMNW